MSRLIDCRTSYASFTRAVALVLTCIAAVCCGGAHAQGCVYQSPDGHPYKWQHNFQPQSGTVQGLPLKIVAFGDSVVWGDGDKPRHRIVWLVSQNIANVTGRPVELDSYAHSGAWLGSAATANQQSNLPVHNGTQFGNLDAEFPTTWQQVQCAAKDDSDAQYVLMDGCINEVGATNIALPPVFTHITTNQIRQLVFASCAANMRDTLENVGTDFPKAKVVLLNYFQIVSKDSKPKPFLETKTQAPPQETPEQKQQEKELEKAVKKSAKHAPAPADRHPSAAEVKQQVQAWQANSVEFLQDTTSCFSWAIASATAGSHDAPTEQEESEPACAPYQPAPGAADPEPHIVLATISNNPGFTYGAPETHLWLMPVPILFGLFAINPDEMFYRRNWECLTHPFRHDLSCQVNPIAHPNLEGAQCYSQTIADALGMHWDPSPGTPAVTCK